MLTDPYNQELHNMANLREDQFIAEYMSRRKRFAQKYDLYDLLTHHPKGMKKNKEGEYDPVDTFDINGGPMFSNKTDNWLTVHRPNAVKSPQDTQVEIHIQKIKKKRLVGKQGMVPLDFRPQTNRYYTHTGVCPFDVKTQPEIGQPEKIEDIPF